MKAGRELDALIAEKVMGRKRAHYILECDDPYYNACKVCGLINSDFSLEDTECSSDPTYSADIAAAWEVLEKLNHLHPQLSYCDTTGSWVVEFLKSERETKARSEDSVMHAICLAALKAVGYAGDQAQGP